MECWRIFGVMILIFIGMLAIWFMWHKLSPVLRDFLDAHLSKWTNGNEDE